MHEWPSKIQLSCRSACYTYYYAAYKPPWAYMSEMWMISANQNCDIWHRMCGFVAILYSVLKIHRGTLLASFLWWFLLSVMICADWNCKSLLELDELRTRTLKITRKHWVNVGMVAMTLNQCYFSLVCLLGYVL